MSDTPPDSNDLDQLKRALVALKRARIRIDSLELARSEPIAIIGIGCRLPGDANSPAAFWRLLRDGRSAIVEIPPERWPARDYFDPRPDTPGKMQAIYGGFIKNVDLFDPHFFGISPREANAMDPQQRLVLEVAWEALEDAGIVPASLAGSSTGVFIGLGINDYGRLQVVNQEVNPALIDTYYIQGNALCITANRLSYALDLQGPSMVVDTACSSSLVAIHVACQSLRSGESTLALAGGSNLMLAPANSISLGKFLAPDGRCKTFDARADGYARGEGSIIVVLKRLSDAVRSGDSIYAVIRGTASNQDGFSSGLTVPNGMAQEALLREALRNAGVEAGQVDYVEAHGTGTSLGDPIEANALGAVVGAGRPAGQELLIGSVKTNIGHLEAGAGIAGLVKVALALHYGAIPPSLNFESPNPHIDFEKLRLRVPTALTPWPRRQHPSRAGVSSFGFGGTNAHAVLEAFPARPKPAPPSPDRPKHLLALSAKSAAAVTDQARRWAEYLSTHPEVNLGDLCYSANVTRSHFAHRLAVVADSPALVSDELTAFANGQTSNVLSGQADRSAHPGPVFLFTGQGAQYLGMGRQLYETQPTFRSALDRCAEILRPWLGLSILSVMGITASPEPPVIDQTQFTQPALFALEYALVELWRSWGVEPAAVMGHSVGEYVAACVAGALSLEDGLKLIAARGRLMGALPPGGKMAAIGADETRVAAAIAPYAQTLSLAAVNGSDNVVISGPEIAVQAVVERFQAEGAKTHLLSVSHAFHSPLMEPMLAEFEAVARDCACQPPRLPLISNITGRAFQPGELANSTYWRAHVRAPVRFAQGIQFLDSQGYDLFLEIGPHPTLCGMGKNCLPQDRSLWLPSLRQGQDEWGQMLRSLGTLYVQGADVNLSGFERDYLAGRQRLSLPTYPFQRERFWFRASASDSVVALRQRGAAPGQGEHPLLGRCLRSPAIRGTAFETQLGSGMPTYVGDHRVYGVPVLPATAYLEMALAATQAAALEDVLVREALFLTEKPRPVQILVSPQDGNGTAFEIHSLRDDASGWQLHASGRVAAGTAAAPAEIPTLDQARTRCQRVLSPSDWYRALAATGMDYGPSFQTMVQLWGGEQAALGQVRLLDGLNMGGYRLHPALLDGCLQVLSGALPFPEGDTFLPIGMDRFIVYAEPREEAWSYAVLREAEHAEAAVLVGDVYIYDPGGQLAALASGVRLKRASRTAMQQAAQRSRGAATFAGWLYQVAWQPKPAVRPAPVSSGRWLIFADRQGIGASLAARLNQPGQSPWVITPGPLYQAVNASHRQLNPASLDDFRRLLSEAQADGQPLGGVVHLWNLENAGPEAPAGQPKAVGLASVLHLVQAFGEQPKPLRLWLATCGAQPVETSVRNIAQSPVWGLARVIRLEHPDWQTTCIDLDPASIGSANALDLLAELQAEDGENQIAYRNQRRFVARLQPYTTQAAAAPIRLAIPSRGTFDNLTFHSFDRRPPGPGEVEIRVRATGLNFRDVLNALGMYPGEAGALGHECAGTVAAIGLGVTDLRVGDEVLALAGDCFATFAYAPALFVARKPQALTFEAATTLPIAFLTAAYALNHLGQMQAGQRVLIHAAAGGVGLAAVQLAQQAGLEIFATAGSPEKRAFLQALGVSHVMDSRSLAFSDEVMRLTNGEGVDLVLNSLADEFIPKSLAVLKVGGCFLEIGKRGVWEPAQVAQLGRQIDYHVIYLGGVCQEEPALIGALFKKLLADINSGDLHPLPWRAFTLEQAAEAFRYMAQAKHIGKIVLTQPAGSRLELPAICPTATYLITGGLGGLGLVTAQGLVERGARALVLVGRRPPSESAQAAISQMQAKGAHVLALQADVSQATEVRRILDTIQKELPPLKGIFHAAGVLDDGLLAQQSWGRFEAVMAPKVDAAWHLHELTQDIPLDLFVLFAAGAGILGSAGQGNYAAANVFLDALAHLRTACGLPALTVDWGPWGQVGMAANLEGRMTSQGFGVIQPEQGMQVLEHLLGQEGQVLVLPIDWPAYLRPYEGRSLPPFYTEVARTVRPTAPTGHSAVDVLKRIVEAPPNQQKGLLQKHVREQAGRVLGISASQTIDPQQPLKELGLDSLMAVELRNALGASLKRSFPATLLFDYPAVGVLTDYLAALVLPAEPLEEPAISLRPEPRAKAAEVTQLEQLSEDEAEALLLQELAAAKKRPGR